MCFALQSAAARKAFMYVQGDSYRTATGKYEKLSCDNVTKLGKIIVSANRNRGIGCRESDSGSLTRGPGSQTPGTPGLGIGSMFNFVRIWSNLDQITALVKANRVDMPKTIRIFVQLKIRVCAYPRTKAVLLDRKGRCGKVLCRWIFRRGMEELYPSESDAK